MKAVLPEALSKDYEIVGDRINLISTDFGIIHFSKLTAKRVEDLIKKGYSGLRRKQIKSFPELPVKAVVLEKVELPKVAKTRKFVAES